MIRQPTVWYFPIETYQERYTFHLEAWVKSAAEKHGVKLVSVKPSMNNSNRTVGTGVVLDAYDRSLFSLQQVVKFIEHLRAGDVVDGDIIYIADMWTSGLSAIPYILSQSGVHVKTYGMCYAQSVDPHDFTYPMRSWMRHYERGMGSWFHRIMVGSQCHGDMLVGADICPPHKIIATGQVYDSKSVLEFYYQDGSVPLLYESDNQTLHNWDARKRQVVFSARWDVEKQPWFYLQVAKYVHEVLKRPDIQFVASTSRSVNSTGYKRMFTDCMDSGHVTPLRLDKRDYYKLLAESRVQFNCSLQDFISYTLIEACQFGCIPVYPKYLSFPELGALHDFPEQLYTPWNIQEAAELIVKGVHTDQVKRNDYNFLSVVRYNDNSIRRIFEEMGVI